MMQSVISISQAILLCLEKAYQIDDQISAARFLKHYINGTEKPRVLLEDVGDFLGRLPYEVAYNHEAINNDPARRYFETVFACHGLMQAIDSLGISVLLQHLEIITKNLATHFSLAQNSGVATIVDVVKGELPESYLARIGSELSFDESVVLECRSITSAINHNFSGSGLFSSCTLHKLRFIVYIFLHTMIWAKNLRHDYKTPLSDLYREGFYQSVNRGRYAIAKLGFSHPYVVEYGIMRLNAAKPYHLFSGDNVAPWHRPGDKCNYNFDSLWVEHNFASHVHPFVSSISGMMLAQLKFIAAFREQFRGLYPGTSLLIFLKCFALLLIYKSGGHSLYEFFAPIKLHKVCEYLGEYFPLLRSIDFEGFLYLASKDAVLTSVQETIRYNRHLLARQAMLQQLDKKFDASV